jgi:hypothetical protein
MQQGVCTDITKGYWGFVQMGCKVEHGLRMVTTQTDFETAVFKSKAHEASS